MKWNEENEKIRGLIQANLNYCEEEALFYERLLEILDSSPNKVSFLEKAEQKVCDSNPWLRDNLSELLNTIEGSESYL